MKFSLKRHVAVVSSPFFGSFTPSACGYIITRVLYLVAYSRRGNFAR